MSDQRSATIIRFPRPSAAASADQLSEALAALSKALTEQQAALHRWREAMAELAHDLQSLSRSVARSADA